MKVMGTADHVTTDELTGISQGDEYLGGGIVILSRYEMEAIKMLQDACEGFKSDYLRLELGKPKDAIIDDLFMLVYRFAEAKFAINDFKDKIEGLENVLEGKKDE